MNYGMFFAGMLAMASLGGLIAFLIIRPWTRPMRRDWEASHEVIAENSRFAAAQVRRQTAEEQDRANEADVAAEQTRSRLIETRGENDRADAEEKVRAIQAEIAVENARVRLIEIQAENDQLEIERRTALRRTGIDPDALPPCKPNWLHKHWFFAFVGLIILIIILSKLNLI